MTSRIKQLRHWVEQGKVTVTFDGVFYRAEAIHPFRDRTRWKFIGWDWSFCSQRIGKRSACERDEDKQAWIETLIIDPNDLNEDQVTALESLVPRVPVCTSG